MSKVDPTSFKQGGCAEFLYGQYEAKLRSYEDDKSHIEELKRWQNTAEKKGFRELASILYSYYKSQRESLAESLNEAEQKLKLIEQAKIIDEVGE